MTHSAENDCPCGRGPGHVRIKSAGCTPTAEKAASLDGVLAELGRQARSLGACPICWALVAPGLRDQHLDWHASLAREVERERLPQVYGSRPIPPEVTP